MGWRHLASEFRCFVMHCWRVALLLFSKKKQGTELKYVPSFMSKGNRFLLNNQLLDNMFYALVSGVLIWSCYEVLMFWAMANGYVQMITFKDHPIWFILALPMIFIWIAFHFYCVHRLLHIKFLYGPIHSLHHRNIATGPFSGISMHPVEHLFYFHRPAFISLYRRTQCILFFTSIRSL